MQTNTTNHTTNASDTTSSSAPTLADYLEARTDERRRAQESYQQQQQREAEQQRERYLANWSEVINNNVSAGLLRALELSAPQFIDKTDPNDEEYGDYYSCVEATFMLDGETWTLRHWNGGLYVCGPNDYTVNLERRWTTEKGWSYNRAILDAINDYPQWVIDQQEYKAKRAAEEAAAAAAAAAAAEEARKPRHYTAPSGTNPQTCLLHRGAYVTIWYVNYYYTEIGPVEWGTVEAFDKHWLLLTSDNGRQQLINRRHIATIEPREKPKAQPEPAPAPAPETPAEQTPQRYNPDMMSDEIPF